MMHMLTETSVFVTLPNGCLCQLMGEPIIHVRVSTRPANGIQSTRPAKRSSLQDPSHEPLAKRLKISHDIKRTQFFKNETSDIIE